MTETKETVDQEASPEAAPSTRAARRQMRDYLRSHEQRRRQLPRALLVGILAGLVAVGFQWALNGADHFREELLTRVRPLGMAGLLIMAAFSSVGVYLAIFLVRRFEPDASGSGIPHVKAVLSHLRSLRWSRLLPVKFFGGVSGIGAGLALGREGPTIQMGASIGQMVGSWFRSTPREKQTLIAAGSGAGLSAAFNAPLAGLVFVLEEVQKDFAPAVFTVTLIASVTADVVARSLYGHLPVFHVGTYPIPSLATLPFFFILGALAGIAAVGFNRGLVASLDLFARIRARPLWQISGVAGVTLAVVGWTWPGTLSGGHRIVEATLAGSLPLQMLVGFLLLRFFLTMGSYGTGAPGGIFAPLLVLGAALGMISGDLAATAFPEIIGHPKTFALVGMAALFAGVVRAPLTAIVLMVEMTGDYSMVLPLLVAVLTAGGVADYLGDPPIYEALLGRDLARWREKPALPETLLLELTVGPGASFEQCEVRDLGLPPGCILISVQRRLESVVPTADFVLEAGDRITVVVAPQAAEAVPLLHRGVAPGRET